METGKFKSAATNENNPNWNILIKRQDKIYKRPDDVRSDFDRDYTRVLHSLAYRRLKHKTQVFFKTGNDHICTRIEHVAHVESVSNTIAKYLGLNEELTKAIAAAHDLGHAPFGHQGEDIIKSLTVKYLNKEFWHEQNGAYFVDNVELLEDNQRNFQNLNLTYAVRDGIISHCGEVDENAIIPRKELFTLDKFQTTGQYQAATWEGCVVKLADKIAYLGRDIEDAVRLGFLEDDKVQMLQNMARLNNQNAINTTVIMHNMIIDLCQNSSIEKGLCLSQEMSQQLDEVKKFNYQYIYKNKKFEPFKKYSELVINQLFEALLEYYSGEDTIHKLNELKFDNKLFVKEFANWIVRYCDIDFKGIEWAGNISKRCENKKTYGDLTDQKMYIQAIIDYIAGMTDHYAISAFNELLEF